MPPEETKMTNEPRENTRRILVIDDQSSIHEDFKKILGSEIAPRREFDIARSAFFGREPDGFSSPDANYDMVSAYQGDEGIELCRDAKEEGDPFAMAFVDVRMPPGKDGVLTIQALWEIDPELQVVICTAFSDYSFEQIVEKLGATDRLLILKKPFDPVEVRQLAAALTEKRSTIRQLHEQMEELRLARVRAEAANRAKSDFLANMSHEIRTPMNAILGYVDLLCDSGATEEERHKYTKTIRYSSDHLLAILNDVLDISRIEASRLVVNAADFEPFELVREVAALMVGQASKKDLNLTIEVPRPIPEVIESDLVRVRQILLNLVGNAIKFTRRGQIKIVVHLDELDESDHRYLCFDVIDTGIGIAEEKLTDIFDAFNQGDNSSTRRFGGTGLGLTISKRLALLLGGDIGVESEVGQGTRFTLRLYAGELIQGALRQYTPSECMKFQGVQLKPIENLNLDAHVLLVEDVVLNRRLMTALLRKAGAEVEEAENGRDCLDKALAAHRAGRPHDLILMDMQMPVMDGYEATRALREAGCVKPILALTAHAMAGDRERCLEVGCSEYATKPVDRDKLLRICDMLLEKVDPPGALPSDSAADGRVVEKE